MENITICYLSWKRNEVFDQTLKSHRDNGLFDLILPENRIIFFQEICTNVMAQFDRVFCIGHFYFKCRFYFRQSLTTTSTTKDFSNTQSGCGRVLSAQSQGV